MTGTTFCNQDRDEPQLNADENVQPQVKKNTVQPGTFIKKDVYWQTSHPVNTGATLSTGDKMDIFSSLLLNENNLINYDKDVFNQFEGGSIFEGGVAVFDDRSTTSSEDSFTSLDSIEEQYQMLREPKHHTVGGYATKGSITPISPPPLSLQTQFQYSSGKTITPTKNQNAGKSKQGVAHNRQKISPVYANDPYIQRHRLMVNARQKNRMTKINNMYTMLSTLLPDHVACEPNVKPHSKLGILKRAIVYWESLSGLLVVAAGESSSINQMTRKQHTNSIIHSPPPKTYNTVNKKTENRQQVLLANEMLTNGAPNFGEATFLLQRL